MHQTVRGAFLNLFEGTELKFKKLHTAIFPVHWQECIIIIIAKKVFQEIFPSLENLKMWEN